MKNLNQLYRDEISSVSFDSELLSSCIFIDDFRNSDDLITKNILGIVLNPRVLWRSPSKAYSGNQPAIGHLEIIAINNISKGTGL